MANMLDIPLALTHDPAQYPYQEQGIAAGWHPQMTQSVSACYAACAPPSLQAAVLPQQPPPKVGRPFKSINRLIFNHNPFWCIAGSVDRSSTAPTTTRLRAALRLGR